VRVFAAEVRVLLAGVPADERTLAALRVCEVPEAPADERAVLPDLDVLAAFLWAYAPASAQRLIAAAAASPSASGAPARCPLAPPPAPRKKPNLKSISKILLAFRIYCTICGARFQ
jgi:hypothetical protein